MQKPLLNLAGLSICMIAAYAALPAMGKMPRIELKSLKPYTSAGCGQSSFNTYSVTAKYHFRNPKTNLTEPLIATPALRQELSAETASLGMSKSTRADGAMVYRRAWNTLLTRKAYSIIVYPDGKIFRASTNQKWPYQ